jgi:histidine ammonia-lyase
MAMLAVLASQAFHVTGRAAPPQLASFLDEVRDAVAPVDADRALGEEMAVLAARFTHQVIPVG